MLLLSLEWPATWSPLKRRRLTTAEAAQLRDFSCLDASCYKPADRAMLLQRIEDEWGSAAEFDTFVRTELRDVMADCKLQFHGRMARIAAESIELVLGG